MAFSVQMDQFQFSEELARGVRGKRVLITGAGRDRGLGQAFALAAGLGGAAVVGVHFKGSYADGIDLVDALRSQGVNAFPVQADVTNVENLWATRSDVLEQMGGLPPNLLICSAGLTEKGYGFGRGPRGIENQPEASRGLWARNHFMSSLEESKCVLETKIYGFMATTHLWAAEAVSRNEPLQVIYVSSRQATEPGVSVPGYVIANWAILQLPRVLAVNLGSSAKMVTASSILLPFVRTGMTEEYANNPKVFGRFQPRMLETFEVAEALMHLLAQPQWELDQSMFELAVEGRAENLRTSWKRVLMDVRKADLLGAPMMSEPELAHSGFPTRAREVVGAASR